jgi:hypothetical protein
LLAGVDDVDTLRVAIGVRVASLDWDRDGDGLEIALGDTLGSGVGFVCKIYFAGGVHP